MSSEDTSSGDVDASGAGGESAGDESTESADPSATAGEPSFIVGVGSSAGGLEVEAPRYESLLPALLGRATHVEVTVLTAVEDGGKSAPRQRGKGKSREKA